MYGISALAESPLSAKAELLFAPFPLAEASGNLIAKDSGNLVSRDDERLREPCGPCLGASGRRRALRQRRLLRAEGEFVEAVRARLRRGQVHGARQVDGRVGVAPPPHARLRL